MRHLAIGDIHGCRASLEHLAEFVGFDESDTIITLGDVVDRGPDSKGVIEFLIRLTKSHQLIPLMGNHETMMLEARTGRGGMFMWTSCGGDAVLDSYEADTLDDIPDEHWAFIENTQRYHETSDHFFVHAGVSHDLALKDQTDDMLFWEFFEDPLPHQSGKTMVCGHTSQKSGIPRNIGHAICIDTFAHGDGWLTCLDVNSGIYWQTNEEGERRQGEIDRCLE